MRERRKINKFLSELFEQVEVLLPDSLGYVEVVLLVEVEISRVLSPGHQGNHRGDQLPLIDVFPAGFGKIAAMKVFVS